MREMLCRQSPLDLPAANGFPTQAKSPFDRWVGYLAIAGGTVLVWAGFAAARPVRPAGRS